MFGLTRWLRVGRKHERWDALNLLGKVCVVYQKAGRALNSNRFGVDATEGSSHCGDYERPR
jgi:hypothetical protein